MGTFFPWMASELESLAERGLLRASRTARRQTGGWCEVDGRRLRDFASNDYLGLSHDPRLVAAAREAADCGAGAGASPLVVGRSPWHERLERRLAEFERQEAAILFPTGFDANVGTIAALVGPEDAVFSDRFNHASLIDGCRISGAVIHIFDHDRLDQLDELLAGEKHARRKLIVTDGVFSMDGVLARLPELCGLSRRFGAELLVDEAHATGVIGPQGRGTAELFGVEDQVAVRIGTLSKALGSIGGFVVGSRMLIEWLRQRARPHMFSTAAPPSACAAADTALDVVQSEPHRREKVLKLAKRLRLGIEELGLKTVAEGIAPIVPVILDEPQAALRAAELLEERGFLVGAMRPPSVPPGSSRLRIGVSAFHEPDDIERLLDALAQTVVVSACGPPSREGYLRGL